MFKVKIHGTYPFDNFGKWRTVERHISLAEVVKLVGAEVTQEQLEKHEEAEQGTRFPEGEFCYLWLNKGFVLIGKPEVNGVGEDGYLGVACAELLGGSPQVKDIKKGDRAVYLHDGSYSIIERVED